MLSKKPGMFINLPNTMGEFCECMISGDCDYILIGADEPDHVYVNLFLNWAIMLENVANLLGISYMKDSRMRRIIKEDYYAFDYPNKDIILGFDVDFLLNGKNIWSLEDLLKVDPHSYCREFFKTVLIKFEAQLALANKLSLN